MDFLLLVFSFYFKVLLWFIKSIHITLWHMLLGGEPWHHKTDPLICPILLQNEATLFVLHLYNLSTLTILLFNGKTWQWTINNAKYANTNLACIFMSCGLQLSKIHIFQVTDEFFTSYFETPIFKYCIKIWDFAFSNILSSNAGLSPCI